MRRTLVLSLCLLTTSAWAEPPAPEGGDRSPTLGRAAPSSAATPAPAGVDASAQHQEGPAPEPAVTEAVQKSLLAPLAAKERARSRFSRARAPASVRRVRVLEPLAKTDANGASFVTYAVDERHDWETGEDGKIPEEAWRREAIVGCVYLERGEVYVKRGKQYHRPEVLLGKKATAAPEHACVEKTRELAAAE